METKTENYSHYIGVNNLAWGFKLLPAVPLIQGPDAPHAMQLLANKPVKIAESDPSPWAHVLHRRPRWRSWFRPIPSLAFGPSTLKVSITLIKYTILLVSNFNWYRKKMSIILKFIFYLIAKIIITLQLFFSSLVLTKI